MKISGLAIAYSVSLTVWAASPSVTKVEPPDWWVGHSINPVRLLVYGSDLNGATLTAPPPLSVSDIKISQRGTYLFVSLRIPADAKAGSYDLKVKTRQGETKIPFRVNPALQSSRRLGGFTSSDVIYELMPDRFSNGDPGNDGLPPLFDRSNPRAYHGGDFQGVINHLPYLKELGTTAIWMTPVYDNSDQVTTDEGRLLTDYHGYGAVDYYGVEEHFGDLATLQRLVGEAHRSGIKIIQDQVANHVGPKHPWVTDPPTPTWFHGTLEHHINETWNGWALPDPASEPLRQAVLEGWFGDRLPDLNQEDPEVHTYEIQNTLWWIGEVGFDAIRQDTWQYVQRDFWRDWMLAIKRQFPDVNVIGEVLQPDPLLVSFFQGGKEQQGIDSHLDSLFDYPYYFALRNVFTEGQPLSDLPAMLSHDGLYSNPNLLWTFLGDHDEPRLMNYAKVDAAALKLAYTCMFAVRGVPFVYSGDEIGMKGGEDPDNRRDFPGGWREDPRCAFKRDGRTDTENNIFDHVQKLARLRTTVPALAEGSTTNLLVQDHAWIFVRRTANSAALVAINDSDQPVTLKVPLEDSNWRGSLGCIVSAQAHSGEFEITVPARCGEIFTRQ